jgi:hypothetical protein
MTSSIQVSVVLDREFTRSLHVESFSPRGLHFGVVRQVDRSVSRGSYGDYFGFFFRFLLVLLRGVVVVFHNNISITFNSSSSSSCGGGDAADTVAMAAVLILKLF